ncbi:MAG: hypothetical protein CVT92_00090 [Bacteroidetes bacterium HGW-Bacteroidetes-1]|jgi:uncharacterized SAM-binding protein YcdF (DUF218 family)|nr:MAG: hypothetical protein CVT92_00090 [Bacteroidetes bacterium HGW-Bacteroidetes-1]
MSRIQTVLKTTFGILKKIIFGLGLIFGFMLILSFTEYPYLAYHWLGTNQIEKQSKSDYIILLGAGGMPSPQGLLRCYYAANAAIVDPESAILIALPADTNNFTASDHYAMIAELKKRGIDSTRIFSESKGTNTHRQALEIKRMIKDPEARLLIITSPDHMHRSILSFRKIGFKHVNGIPTFENSFDEYLLLEKNAEDEVITKPESNLDLRYNMWSYLQYEILVIREYTAITYYKLKGYI